jgi:hypothetical protein
LRPSAAQNTPVKTTCLKCGLVHDEDFPVCGAADALPSPVHEQIAAAAVRPEGEPSWRREVSERLESYRARRGRYRSGGVHGALQDDSQALLTFNSANGNGYGPSIQTLVEEGAAERQSATDQEEMEEHAVRRAALRTASRPRRAETVEITVPQPQFDFSAGEVLSPRPQNDKRPVADLRERRRAGLFDAVVIGMTWAGFFLAYHMMGGEFPLTR